jgi:hypothetical protein
MGSAFSLRQRRAPVSFEDSPAVGKQLEDDGSDAIVIPKSAPSGKKGASGNALSMLHTALYTNQFKVKLTKQKRKLDEHKGVVEFQQVVSSPFTPVPDYVAAIIDEAVRRCDCELASVFFYDEVRNDMWCVGSKDLTSFSIKFGVGIVGMVAKSGKAVNLEDARSNPQFFNKIDDNSGFQTKSILAVPFTHPKNARLTIGVLEVMNKIGSDAFTSKDILECKKLVILLGESFYRQRFVAIQTRSEGDAEALSVIAHYSEKSMAKRAQKKNKRDSFVSGNVTAREAHALRPLVGAFGWPNFQSNLPPEFTSSQFDVLSFEADQLQELVYLMLEDTGCIGAFDIPEKELKHFIAGMQKLYRHNPFHNWFHGFGVMHFCYVQLKNTQAGEYLTHLEVFAVLIAGLGHDADHPGFTNAYLVETDDPIALHYNDVSVLENHHAAKTCNLLRDPNSMITINLSKKEKRSLRYLVITAILATDMSHHQSLCKEVVRRSQRKILPFDKQKNSDRMFLLKIMIHASDLSIQTFPWRIASKWEQRISEEFANQAEQETLRGMPVLPFMQNLDNFKRRGKLQCDFIDYCLVPLWDPYTNLFFELRHLYDSLKLNRSRYAGRVEDAYSPIPPKSNLSNQTETSNPPNKSSNLKRDNHPKAVAFSRFNDSTKRRTVSYGDFPRHESRGLNKLASMPASTWANTADSNAGQKRGSPYKQKQRLVSITETPGKAYLFEPDVRGKVEEKKRHFQVNSFLDDVLDAQVVTDTNEQ